MFCSSEIICLSHQSFVLPKTHECLVAHFFHESFVVPKSTNVLLFLKVHECFVVSKYRRRGRSPSGTTRTRQHNALLPSKLHGIAGAGCASNAGPFALATHGLITAGGDGVPDCLSKFGHRIIHLHSVPGSSFHSSELFCPECLTEKLIWPKKTRDSRYSEEHGCF
jgi:hypothetical protein